MRLWLPALWANLVASRALGARIIQDRNEVTSTSISSYESTYTYNSGVLTKQARSIASGYVSAPGDGHLYLNGELFDFRVFNTPTILNTDCEYEIQDLLQTIVAFGTPVTRTYTLRVANDMFEGGSMQSSKAHVIGWDETTGDWRYNETVWKQVDLALALSRNYGVRLIIPIINQDYGASDTDYVGNFNDLIRHRYNISSYAIANKAVDWFTDRNMIEGFKKLISFVANRINTINHIRYGDDETILAFETGNELNWGDATRVNFQRPPPAPWTLEIAEHIKSLAPHTLVMDGSFSRAAKNGTYWEKSVLESKDVDLFSYHLYGDGDLELYDGLRDEARAHGKTLIIGEHGFYSSAAKYSKAYQKFDCAGTLIWSLRGHSEKGGFVTHGEGNNIYSYHAPGWHHQTSKSFDIHEADVISLTYNASFAVLGQEPPPKPIPGPPRTSFVTNGTHPGLTWRGSAWADHYEIYGGHVQGFSFSLLSNQVLDNVGSGELFVPLDPQQPTKKLFLPPPVYKTFESQQGWEDRKWCVPGSACYNARVGNQNNTSSQFSQFSGFQSEFTSFSSSTTNIIYQPLPVMHPAGRKRALQGGWYSVRGVSADGIPGRSSSAMFLKTDWLNWSVTQ